jgi:KDO2-lipid IV(A) lauroyltransferase
MAHMTFLSPEDVLKRVRIEGAKHLEAALGKRRGVVIVSAHLGNWEMTMLSWAARFETPITVVSKKLGFEPFNRWSQNLRDPFNIQIIWKKNAFPHMVQAMRARRIMVLTLDLNRNEAATEVQFFGRRVNTTYSAALLALRCKSPVVPAFCYREPNGRLAAYIEPELVMQRTGNLRSDLQVNSQLMTDTIERAIRRYPDQWLWLQKRWKAFYPHLYPEYFEQRRRRKERKSRRSAN